MRPSARREATWRLEPLRARERDRQVRALRHAECSQTRKHADRWTGRRTDRRADRGRRVDVWSDEGRDRWTRDATHWEMDARIDVQ